MPKSASKKRISDSGIPGVRQEELVRALAAMKKRRATQSVSRAKTLTKAIDVAERITSEEVSTAPEDRGFVVNAGRAQSPPVMKGSRDTHTTPGKLIRAHATERRESAEQAREYTERKKAEQAEYNRQSKKDIARRGTSGAVAATATPTKYPSWRDRRQQEAKQATENARRLRRHMKNVQAKARRLRKAAPSCEPSLITGLLLIVFGALDDLLDFATFWPGITAVISTISTVTQQIIVALDSNLRKHSASNRIKLILKRWVILAIAGLIEGLFSIVNLLPLQTIAAFLVRFANVKAKPQR